MQESYQGIVTDFPLPRAGAVSYMIWIVAFSALTAIGAQIEIPHVPVPYTLQTLFVLLAGGVLGRRNGSLSQVLYLLAGMIGLPVFAGFGGGFGRLLGPTGGYLLSFPIAAYCTGVVAENAPTILRSILAMVVGLFVIFSLGALHLGFVYYHNWKDALVGGFFIFSIWDAVKLAAAAAIVYEIRRNKSTGKIG